MKSAAKYEYHYGTFTQHITQCSNTIEINSTADKTEAETNAAMSFTDIHLEHLTTASFIQIRVYSCETSHHKPLAFGEAVVEWAISSDPESKVFQTMPKSRQTHTMCN